MCCLPACLPPRRLCTALPLPCPCPCPLPALPLPAPHAPPRAATQEATTRRLLEHCGVPWEEGVLRFHETQRAVATASLAQASGWLCEVAV